ncbi:ABC transporter permease subunit (plasmid) [Roseibium aggregatum]|uniref:carbohydrate ABC transporter permease n=1 Tax=Roseibium aggregatum TaxID=187304 RepID=UPI002B4B99A9|nr:carbohydrate ABC transporter permease [Roseibium aggregatum]UES60003.1 ABC transporter permease subunit [Roseibium aggregatum]UES60127.1 ABC transporter permease subunit [Roseibium aggregatum]
MRDTARSVAVTHRTLAGDRRIGLARFSRALERAGAHAILLLLVAFVLLPFVWMLLTSLKDPTEIFDNPFGFRLDWRKGWENFAGVFEAVPMVRFMMNGLIVVTGILAVQLVTSVLAAYALAKIEFRGRGLLMALIVFALCIPVQVPALPLYLGLAKFGLLNSYFALMFPWFLSAFAIFLFRQFFKSFPDEIISAARLDGFSEVEIILRLVLPSAKPAIAAFSIFSITAHWNDLYWPLIVVNTLDHMTPPLGMMFFRDSETGTNYGMLMAAATVVTAPLLVLFLFAQRQFIQGITMTGIK